jgi:dipeptidyl-peptidase-3
LLFTFQGINIPNYDDIRQNEGFKNVSLGNVLSAADSKERVTFLHDKDQEIYQKFRISSFEVQVGCHELLGIHYLETSLNLSGHGSGKLFCKKVDGSLNCSSSVLDPISKSPISSWYEVGDTYDSLFGAMSSSFEECRAECVGILLSADRELLELFGYSGKDAEDVTYVNWLDMARKGVLALEFFTPESKKWRQAHMQARFAILQCMLEAGECFIQLDP